MWIVCDDKPLVIRPDAPVTLGTGGAGSSVALWIKGKEVGNRFDQTFLNWQGSGDSRFSLSTASVQSGHYREICSILKSDLSTYDYKYTSATRIFDDWILCTVSWSGTRITTRVSGGVAEVYGTPLNVPSWTLEGDIRIGKGIPGVTSHSDVNFAELSVFDFALDTVSFNELAKGMDPLRLGGGPVLFFSGDLKRDRGCSVISDEANWAPSPVFLQR